MLTEINVDAIVGPTHHFGGLGVGNIASMAHQQQASHPKLAALEGIAKAALIARLGVPQFVWLPPLRPRIDLLSSFGFHGSVSEQLTAAQQLAPRALSSIFSSAFMWAANSATVSPTCDTADQQLHITPANLISSWHRAGEAQERSLDFEQLFRDVANVKIHAPLPSIVPLRDEGAANHMRLCDASGVHGFNLLVYGDDESSGATRSKYLPRQTRASFEAIARSHRLNPETTFFLHQHPDAISAGSFHNDVIATSHHGFLIHHEFAFWQAEETFEQLEKKFLQRTGQALIRIAVSNTELPLADAVRSYFFNSQLLTPPGSEQMTLVCPTQCQTIESARKLVERIVADPNIPIDCVRFVSLHESMANGGGPACLRLRIPVTNDMLAQMNRTLRLDECLAERLSSAIERWYPDCVQPSDLSDPEFVGVARRAVNELRNAVDSKR